MKKKEILNAIKEVLQEDHRVLFAYLYGSFLKQDAPNDIDIAIYADDGVMPHALSADLKVALYRRTGGAPDLFDIRVINDILDKGDLLTLVFLRNVFAEDALLVDRSEITRADFLEHYGMKYRECEGLIAEVLS